MNGDWPPEWEDPEEFPEGTDQLDAEAKGRLSDVTAYLASLPAPVLPDAVEARISAALAAEAAARTGAGERDDAPSLAGEAASGAAEPATSARKLGPAPARARVRRHQGGGVRRALRSRPFLSVGSAVAACLVLAGLGYGLSLGGGPSGTPAASSAAGSAPRTSQAYGPESGSSAAAAVPSASSSSPDGVSLVVITSGTKYQAATLAAQARANVAAAAQEPGPAKAAPASGNLSSLAREPTAALRGCVAHLTGGRSPQLVDLATYQGRPAYIIAGSTEVWVVGLGCTADNPELIASVPLSP